MLFPIRIKLNEFAMNNMNRLSFLVVIIPLLPLCSGHDSMSPANRAWVRVVPQDQGKVDLGKKCERLDSYKRKSNYSKANVSFNVSEIYFESGDGGIYVCLNGFGIFKNLLLVALDHPVLSEPLRNQIDKLKNFLNEDCVKFENLKTFLKENCPDLITNGFEALPKHYPLVENMFFCMQTHNNEICKVNEGTSGNESNAALVCVSLLLVVAVAILIFREWRHIRTFMKNIIRRGGTAEPPPTAGSDSSKSNKTELDLDEHSKTSDPLTGGMTVADADDQWGI